MGTETSFAFDHPEARARATAPEGLHDRIMLRDHVREVEIGAFQPERGVRQRVRFNVVVEVRPTEAGDDVDRILSYDTITEAIGAALAEERVNLLETLAERVARRVLAAPQALRCFVRIEKLDRGPGALGVEIVRTAAPGRRDADLDMPHPLVAYLSQAAVDSPHLGAWLDVIGAAGPAILCVGAAPGMPETPHARAQRRIDLLAIEMTAWRLSGRDPRCVVVGSRTEIDWAVRQGGIVVWAPSKIVLDAVEPPDCGPRDGAALAAWLGGLVEARGLLVIGAEPPRSALPVRTADPGAAALVLP